MPERNLVKYCELTHKTFPDVTEEDLRQLGIGYGLKDLSQFTAENCVKNRNSFGGTSYEEVERQIEAAKVFLEK